MASGCAAASLSASVGCAASPALETLLSVSGELCFSLESGDGESESCTGWASGFGDASALLPSSRAVRGGDAVVGEPLGAGLAPVSGV